MNDPAAPRRVEKCALAAVLLLAAALRLWGVDFGMPFTGARPDEGKVAGIAAGFLLNGSLNPHFFAYPTLFMYVLGATYAVSCGVSSVGGIHSTVTDCLNDDAQLILIGRVVVAFTGVAAVAAVFAIGRRFGRGAGLISALLLAVTFLHVRDSHFTVTDVPMTTMVLLAIVLLLRADESPTTLRFAAAGLVAGLATSTKYNAAFLAGGIVVSQLYAWSQDSSVPAKHTRLVAFAAAALAGFLIGTPFAVVSIGRFLEDVRFESLHLMYPHRGIRVDVGWRHHAMVTLPHAVGTPLLAAGIGGMLLTLATRRRPALVTFAFPLIYYAVAGRGQTVFARYMLPVIPFICLGAGALIAHARDAAARSHPPTGYAVAAALVVLCALPTGLKAVALDRLLTRVDSRVLAAEWIRHRIPAGATILLTGEGFDLISQMGGSNYDIWLWRDRAASITGPWALRPDWIAVEQSPLKFYSRIPPELKPILYDYDFRHTIQAVKLSEAHVYDQQDAFYLPLDGFAGVSRPGPNITFYKRRQLAMNER